MGMSLLGEPYMNCVQIVGPEMDGLPCKRDEQEARKAKKLFPEAGILILYKRADGNWESKDLNEISQ